MFENEKTTNSWQIEKKPLLQFAHHRLLGNVFENKKATNGRQIERNVFSSICPPWLLGTVFENETKTTNGGQLEKELLFNLPTIGC